MKKLVKMILSIIVTLSVGFVPVIAKEANMHTIPALQKVPAEYKKKADQEGTLVPLTYTTYDSLHYKSHKTQITKTAWIYLPYGYDDNRPYNIFYLSHGGWSNETTLMGTDMHPHQFKHIVDHAIEDGRIQPMIIVLLTYNNLSEEDSSDYSLALELTNNYHNELTHDLMPAVESTYHTYTNKQVSANAFQSTRTHRAFGGFSMGSVNTWHTFQYCLDDFYYFLPMSGNLTNNGKAMAKMVKRQGYGKNDFFIYAASGTKDFAYDGFTSQIEAMNKQDMFTLTDDTSQGNMNYRVYKGGVHNGKYCNQYTYNLMMELWNE